MLCPRAVHIALTVLAVIPRLVAFPASRHNRAESASYLDGFSDNQKLLFEYTLMGLDANFGPPFLFNSPRYSAWYAVGLLARNEGDDVATASQLIEDVISYQFKDPSKLWFGTFKNSPSDPDPGDVYTPLIYGSYDPNQALFVATSMIILLEEFQHLLKPSLVALVKESMYNATVGDGYRVGGVNGDNLYPVYSNPWYMRVMSATYVGHMLSDANLTYWGNEWARQGIADFDIYGTLNEFNSGTYNGVVLYALSLWGYMPKNSTIASRATDIIAKTWMNLGEYYNPTLHTLGGPWDRTYGFDMKSYFAILGAQITGIIGGIKSGTAPLPLPLVGSEHYSDAAIGVLLPITSKFHDPYVPKSVVSKLKGLYGTGHSFFTQTVSPPFDKLQYPRNYTSWTGIGLSVGGIQVDENVVGGPATSSISFTPGLILWDTGSSGTGWISHYPTSKSINAIATSHDLTVSYPPSKAFPSNISSSIMTFLISGLNGLTLDSSFLANGTGELPGLRLQLSGNVLNGTRSLIYGVGAINDLSYYNLTYVIPTDLGGEVPEIVWSFEKV